MFSFLSAANPIEGNVMAAGPPNESSLMKLRLNMLDFCSIRFHPLNVATRLKEKIQP
jgi:hypothetical protein